MRLKNTLTFLLVAATLGIAPQANAQTVTDTTMMVPEEEVSEDSTVVVESEPAGPTNMDAATVKSTPTRKWYTTGGFDAALFQTAYLRRPGRNNEFTYLRFSYFVNLGANFNYDFDNNFGVFTGLGIKNIGFTQKESDSTIKRRAYTIGVPLGFKIGNLEKSKYIIIGGGLDVPFNYREKGWKDRHHKTKMSEWFSDRTEDVMPYLFFGASLKKSLVLKIQYYPGNFLNNEFTETGAAGETVAPFSGWDSRLLFISLGMNMNFMSRGSGHGMKHHHDHDDAPKAEE